MRLLRWLDVLRLRGRTLMRRGKVEHELERELAFHLEQLTAENAERGMPTREARDAARRALGGVSQIQEECRDMRRTNYVETIWKDFRYALRTLGRSAGFTAVIVLTLALSVGANSAIFSVIQGVLLRPLPFAQPDRLVRIYFNSDTQPKFPLNPNDFMDFRARNRSFASMAVITRRDVQLSGLGDPVMLKGFKVSAGYFAMLGLNPARGREFSFDDELAGRGQLAVLSDNVWRTKFGADPNIIGRKITLNELPFRVVGVMPAGARHPGNNFHAVPDGETVDVWMPYTFDDSPTDRGSHFLDGIGRLKAGVSPEQANAELSAVLAQMQNEHGGKWRIFLVPLYQELVGRTQRMLWVLLGAVGLLLLIACVNAANLLLARSSARVREIAVRSALGASRGRIVRQLLTESVVIALAGGGLGTLLALGGVKVLVAALPAGFPRATEIRLDAGVFGFTLAVAVITGVLFGLVPALTASRADLQISLREGGRGSTGSGPQLRLRNLLVVGETGLACVLLIAAGLMLHSFVNLLRTDPGFQPENVLTATIALPRAQYAAPEKRVRFFEQLTANLAAEPGVQAAGAGTDLPWTGYDGNADGFTVEGRVDEKTTARYHTASSDYFRALGIPLLRGRFLTARDDRKAPLVIVVNESMANRYWPGEDPIGKRITFRSRPVEQDWLRVVGVVRDVKDQPDSTSVRPGFWLSHAQEADSVMSVVVRSTAESKILLSQFRLAVRQLDPALAIGEVKMMNQVAEAAVASQRLALFLVGLFAALALVLATFGMYGVISYSVNQRMHEFGLRMALGARPWDLVLMIVREGLGLSMTGAAFGLLCAAGVTKLMGSMLYGVSGQDPLTFAGVAVIVMATAAVACYLPSRRAACVDPMVTLRAE